MQVRQPVAGLLAQTQGERPLRTDSGELITDKRQVDFESLKNRFIIGDPDYAIRQVERYRDELAATELICWMHLPGVSGGDAMRCHARFLYTDFAIAALLGLERSGYVVVKKQQEEAAA